MNTITEVLQAALVRLRNLEKDQRDGLQEIDIERAKRLAALEKTQQQIADILREGGPLGVKEPPQPMQIIRG